MGGGGGLLTVWRCNGPFSPYYVHVVHVCGWIIESPTSCSNVYSCNRSMWVDGYPSIPPFLSTPSSPLSLSLFAHLFIHSLTYIHKHPLSLYTCFWCTFFSMFACIRVMCLHFDLIEFPADCEIVGLWNTLALLLAQCAVDLSIARQHKYAD